MVRQLYYALPTRLRFVVRWFVYWPIDLLESVLGRREPLTPPKRLRYTGGGDFRAMGRAHVTRLVEMTDLDSDAHVLEVGSGIGRMALALTEHLSPQGSFEGFDIVKVGVRWCQKHITPRHPNFNFRHFLIRNDLYQKSGTDSAEFRFPYLDKYFDLVILTSVFTHMLPAGVEHYLNEISRVLKPGGHVYVTFFVLNEVVNQAMQLGDGFQFKHDYGNYRLLNAKVPSANVAYEEAYLEEMINRQSLEVFHKVPGFWSGAYPRNTNDFQDIWLLRK